MRSLVAGLGLLSVLAALIVVGYLAATSLGGGLAGGSGGGGAAGSLVLRVSGTAGTPFSGSYTTTTSGTQNVSGTVGATPTDYDLSGGGVAGVNVVSVNLQRGGTVGALKAEILENGQVAQAQETNAANSAVSLTYSP